MDKSTNPTTLRGIEVTGWDKSDRRLRVDAEWEKGKGEVRKCPQCGTKDPDLNKYGHRDRKVHDVRSHGRPVIIALHAQKYDCKECDGSPFVPEHGDISSRKELSAALVERIKEAGLGSHRFKTLAAELGVAVSTVQDIVIEYARQLNKKSPTYPVVLGLDEIRPKRKKEGPYAVISCAKSNELIEMLPTCTKSTILAFLWRNHLQYATEAVVIDMNDDYRDAVHRRLPDADVVVDRYHIKSVVDKAVQEVRLNETVRDEDADDDLTSRLKDVKGLLSKRWKGLNTDQRQDLNGAFKQIDRLRVAYFWKDRFAKIFDLKNRRQADAELEKWIKRLPESIEPEFSRPTKTISNWRDQILNYFDHGYDNGFVEGKNQAIRQIQAEGAGYDFEVLRAKVVHGLDKRREQGKGPAVLLEGLPREIPQARIALFDEALSVRSREFRTGVSFERIVNELELEE